MTAATRCTAQGRPANITAAPALGTAIEVDVASSLDRLGIYAALKVPEVWRLEGDMLTFHVSACDGACAAAARGPLLPATPPRGGALRFLPSPRRAGDQNQVIPLHLLDPRATHLSTAHCFFSGSKSIRRKKTSAPSDWNRILPLVWLALCRR